MKKNLKNYIDSKLNARIICLLRSLADLRGHHPKCKLKIIKIIKQINMVGVAVRKCDTLQSNSHGWFSI